MMSPARFRRLWLVVCLTLLGGLAMSVPVNCVCQGDAHLGQMVHPVFPHHHPEDEARSESHTQSPLDDTSANWTTQVSSALLASFDGSMVSRWNLWMALALLALFTVGRWQIPRPYSTTFAPVTGPPRS